jgi:hypothetical protein
VARFKSLRHGIKKWSKHLSNLSAIINNCNYVIALLDGLEEQRALSIIEENFRKALKEHPIKLLEAKRLYWRKRANIRWATLGDENTKNFHATATRNYRHNHIALLKPDNDIEVTEHDQKAAILWNAFKKRLGISDGCDMMFDLSQMIVAQDLSALEEPFTSEEIDNIIKCMPNDKSPGPDGFNGLFMKKYWYLMKHQFYDLCKAFYNGDIDLSPINTAYIALIPKVDSPVTAAEFRPISLVSMAMKILTKLLANRLQEHIIPLIHQNQYGFIKSRKIQDCLSGQYWS